MTVVVVWLPSFLCHDLMAINPLIRRKHTFMQAVVAKGCNSSTLCMVMNTQVLMWSILNVNDFFYFILMFMALCGVFWIFMMIYGVFWIFMIYGVFWIFRDDLWSILNISWWFMECSEYSWWFMEYSEYSCFMEYSECVMVFSILWCARWFVELFSMHTTVYGVFWMFVFLIFWYAW